MRSGALPLGLALALGACGGPESGSTSDVRLSSALDWYGDNRVRLDAMLDQWGQGSPQYDPQESPVAVFDWDNTVIKNDLADATLFHMLRSGAVLQPPQKNWRLTSPYLTADAAHALGAACDSLAAPGQSLPTHLALGAACADEIVAVYTTGQTVAKKAAFAGWNYRRLEPAYAWAAQLLAGYTPDEARSFGARALDESLAAQQGATQTVGTTANLNGWLRFYPQQQDLIAVLKQRGFDVWIISASPQQIVEAGAARLGIARDHVIGVRMVEENNRLTANLQGCGDIPDGTNDGQGSFLGNSLIPYIEGKRCWINKVVFGDRSAAALSKQPDPARRQVFAAGDSDTDISFMQDATALKLVINRNKKELMCNAYANAHGHWLVNPMFIEPLPQRSAPYACSRDACKDLHGQGVPCRNEDDELIPDQPDRVFGTPPASPAP